MAGERILIVDDEPGAREAFHMILKDDYKVIAASTGKEGLRLVEEESPHLVILDIIMPDMNGIEVLKRIREIDERLAVIMITATKSVKTAVEAMKLGAFDYITKPFEVGEIKVVVEKALQSRAMWNELTYLRSELKRTYGFDNIIGKSEAMKSVFEAVNKVAQTRSIVLITGESGTGKELVARAIHFRSPRQNNPFIAIECAALPENLLESELFGYEKGAFTDATTRKLGRFELADSGTLFLDEIGEMSLSIQAKILRVLENQELVRVGGTKTIKVDVRIITASNRDLKALVDQGLFREDLFYRINVVPIFLSPLRERKEDVPLLVNHFLKKLKAELHSPVNEASPETMKMLTEYDWPGNVRELENVIERILTLSNNEVISPQDLPETFRVQSKRGILEKLSSGDVSLEEATKAVEKELIEEVLKEAHWVVSKAARQLKTTRRILKYKIDSLGIKKPQEW